MQKTNDPQEVQKALELSGYIIQVTAGGRSWRVNGMAPKDENLQHWCYAASTTTYPNSEVFDVEGNEEFRIYTEAEYGNMIDRLRAEEK